MNKSSPHINEKNTPIKIKKVSMSTENKYPMTEYSLKKNVFDPFKNSPPNEFMLKLNMRYFLHYKNEDNRDKE